MTDFGPRTALLVVDVQNDFASTRGSLYVTGAEEILPLINQEVERAASAGALVVYSRDWHPESTPHFAEFGGIWPAHCVAGSWGAEFHPGLRILENSRHILKGVDGEDGYSAFSVRHPTSAETSSTELAELLRLHRIERIVIIGLATDYCVKETALDGIRLGLATTVLRSGVRAVNLNAGDGEHALEAIKLAGGRVE